MNKPKLLVIGNSRTQMMADALPIYRPGDWPVLDIEVCWLISGCTADLPLTLQPAIRLESQNLHHASFRRRSAA